MSAPPPSPRTETFLPRGLRFVLLAHPTVQAVRFLSKAVLAWFLTSEDLGEAVFAGLFVFAAATVAVFGLDEALIHAPRLDAPLWRALRSLHARSGLVVGLALAGAGFLIGGVGDHPLFGALLTALAPVVWIGNAAVLPSALLVRAGAYRQIFLVDLAQVVALTICTWIPAAMGLGPFSLVLGWYGNAIVAVFVAQHLARPFVPQADEGALADGPHTRRFGLHLMGASLFTYGVERLDSLAVGAWLGRAALGLYELAQHLATAVLNYTSNLVERLIFPAFSSEHRAARLAPALVEALRFLLLFVLPLHVLLARVGRELVLGLFPERWAAAAPLLAPLALAAGARSLDLVCVAALKAAGRGRAVLALAWLRSLLLLAALAWALRAGDTATSAQQLALAVLVSRGATALASAATCLARIRIGWRAGLEQLGWAMGLLITWGTFVAAAGELAQDALALSPRAFFALGALLGLGSWVLLRWGFDRAALSRELAWLAARVRRPAQERA